MDHELQNLNAPPNTKFPRPMSTSASKATKATKPDILGLPRHKFYYLLSVAIALLITTLAISLSTALHHASEPLQEKFNLTKKFDSENFFKEFEVKERRSTPSDFTIYVNESLASSYPLFGINEHQQIFLHPDNVTTLARNASGRNSLSVESRDFVNFTLIVADIEHMPASACGIWPQYWLLNAGRGCDSSINVLESISLETKNNISVQTMGPCEMVLSSTEDGAKHNTTLDCNMANNGGCTTPRGPSGEAFNAGGGGVWITFLDSESIKIWFFNRTSIPGDILKDSPRLTMPWGEPLVNYTSSGMCNLRDHFQKLKLIFHIGFCGESKAGGPAWQGWTGCQQATGMDECRDYVAKAPHAFNNAYWLINSIKLYG